MANQIGCWAKRLTSGIGRTIQAHPRLSRMLLAGAVTGTSIGLLRNLTSNPFNAIVWLVLLGIATSLFVWCVRKLDQRGLGVDLSVGLVGVLITYLVLELVVVGVFWKAKLVSDMGSAENDAAVAAVEKLRKRGWLADGTLRGANLTEANLRGANLTEANLREADLRKADLRGANLSRASLGGYKIWAMFEGLGNPLGGPGPWIEPADLREADLQGANLTEADLNFGNLIGANLRGANLTEADLEDAVLHEANMSAADLSGANLHGTDLTKADLRGANLRGDDLFRANLNEADLREANLQGAHLEDANLQEVDLWRANLSGANLSGANLIKADLSEARLTEADLSGADLRSAQFDATTVLPDHTKWTPDTDMARFTDPRHPDFWRSDDPHSPAYRGKDDN